MLIGKDCPFSTSLPPAASHSRLVVKTQHQPLPTGQSMGQKRMRPAIQKAQVCPKRERQDSARLRSSEPHGSGTGKKSPGGEDHFPPRFWSLTPKLRVGESPSSRPHGSLLLNTNSIPLQGPGVWQRSSSTPSYWRSRMAKICHPSPPPDPAATSLKNKAQNRKSSLPATWASFPRFPWR